MTCYLLYDPDPLTISEIARDFLKTDFHYTTIFRTHLAQPKHFSLNLMLWVFLTVRMSDIGPHCWISSFLTPLAGGHWQSE